MASSTMGTSEKVALAGAGLVAVGGLMWWTRGPHPNFTWEELSRTGAGTPNLLTFQAKKNLHRLTWTVLAPLREVFGPLQINSGYRSPETNAAIGGSSTSAHMADEPGEAAVDVQPADPARGDNWAIVEWLYVNGGPMNLDQVIGYTDRTHAHIGIHGARARNQFLSHTAGKYTAWTPHG